jgi:hypothetical protein
VDRPIVIDEADDAVGRSEVDAGDHSGCSKELRTCSATKWDCR